MAAKGTAVNKPPVTKRPFKNSIPMPDLSPALSGSRLKTPSLKDVDGAFQGSFAGTARDIAVHCPRPWYRRRDYYLEGWSDPVIRRAAVVECVATACSIYISSQFGMTLMNTGVTQIAAYVGIFNAVFLTLFIYSTATATGGHLNPMITFTTVLCGLTPLPRGVVLITAQIIGSILAGGVLFGCWGRDRALSHMGGGNFFDTTQVSPGQALLTETASSFTILYLAIGTGLDPRQQVLYGRQLGPLLVGLSLGLVSCATTGVAPGYTGAGMNPGRAIAIAIAGWNWRNHWVWWAGPALASILIALMYSFAPPCFADRVKHRTMGETGLQEAVEVVENGGPRKASV